MKHLAAIMDGNRRWAKKQGLLATMGHSFGIEAAQRIISFCLEKEIRYLSLYALSVENLGRPADELSYLFNLAESEARRFGAQALEQGVRLHFIGDWALFPPQLVSLCQELEKKTEACSRLQVQILFCYGGQQEIVSAVQSLAKQVIAGSIAVDAISKELLEKELWTHQFPHPDLIIRPGGHKRLSNFLLYQAAYAEIYFTDTLWPDITETELSSLYNQWQETQRNFGT